jgi:hypothetical protein
MPSMLPYVGIYLGTMVAIALIIGNALRRKDEEQQVFEEVCCEHRVKALQLQHEAETLQDDFLAAVDEISAECLEPEVGSVEWLEAMHSLGAREPGPVR